MKDEVLTSQEVAQLLVIAVIYARFIAGDNFLGFGQINAPFRQSLLEQLEL